MYVFCILLITLITFKLWPVFIIWTQISWSRGTMNTMFKSAALNFYRILISNKISFSISVSMFAFSPQSCDFYIFEQMLSLWSVTISAKLRSIWVLILFVLLLVDAGEARQHLIFTWHIFWSVRESGKRFELKPKTNHFALLQSLIIRYWWVALFLASSTGSNSPVGIICISQCYIIKCKITEFCGVLHLPLSFCVALSALTEH